MAVDRSQFIKLYLNRLANTLVPPEFGAEYVNSLVNDLVNHLTWQQSSSNPSLPHLLEQYEHQFISRGKHQEWYNFSQIVERIMQKKSHDEVARYLAFLAELIPQTPSEAHDHLSHSYLRSSHIPQESSPKLHSSSAQSGSSTNVALSQVLGPYFNSGAELELLKSLRFVLIGQDTSLLSFSDDLKSISIPASINFGHSQVLGDILEPALLFKVLSKSFEKVKGHEKSPTKTAFYRFAESQLNEYVTSVSNLFQESPHSLLALMSALTTQVHALRLLSYLQSQCEVMSGFEFLNQVYSVSQFGDLKASKMATDIFSEMSNSYFEYLEHWIIKGELIDENNEFFVSFDPKESHINDIIRYEPSRLPPFLNFTTQTFQKILQIGKTLVFLEKYCRELDWVNMFATKYYQFIFVTNKGLSSMSLSAIQDLINTEYSEALNYLTSVVHTKYRLYSHLLNIKKVMLMEAGDFIDVIIKNGAEDFEKPALSLTSGRISEILTDSINQSTMKNLPIIYRNRLDARILDLSHGTIGWDVFTLDYKINEPALDTLLNYRNQGTQYLRLFNFLWSLRHFQYLLEDDFLSYQNLNRNDLRAAKARYSNSSVTSRTALERIHWLSKTIRLINLIRNRLHSFFQTILNYTSFYLIQDSFEKKINQALFKTTSVLDHGMSETRFDRLPQLSVLDDQFLQKYKKSQKLLNEPIAPSSPGNMKECTVDELTNIQSKFLQNISDSKLLREDARGRQSGKSFIEQIFNFLEIAFAFVKSSEEFGASMSNYINLFNVRPDISEEDFDENLNHIFHRMNSVKTVIVKDLFVGRFKPALEVFGQDLKSDMELKDLSKLI